ncbi:MAG: hypothetical protein WBO45_13690, partial [Planctomycetota bacterium]
ADLVACVLASPRLAETLDLAALPDLGVDVATLLAWTVDAVALGRQTTADALRYLMARAAEQPALQALLGTCHQRALKMPEPANVFAGLLAGRRRLTGETERRAVRLQLQQALADGDQARASELQHLLLTRLRTDRPRPSPSS